MKIDRSGQAFTLLRYPRIVLIYSLSHAWVMLTEEASRPARHFPVRRW